MVCSIQYIHIHYHRVQKIRNLSITGYRAIVVRYQRTTDVCGTARYTGTSFFKTTCTHDMYMSMYVCMSCTTYSTICKINTTPFLHAQIHPHPDPPHIHLNCRQLYHPMLRTHCCLVDCCTSRFSWMVHRTPYQ